MTTNKQFASSAEFFKAVVKESCTGIADERLEEKPGERDKWAAVEAIMDQLMKQQAAGSKGVDDL
jgi:hypothetical protein